MTPQDLLAVAEREEFIAIELIVRALQVTRRALLKSWDKDGVPYIREGRAVRLHRDVLKARYYRGASPVSTRTSSTNGPVTS